MLCGRSSKHGPSEAECLLAALYEVRLDLRESRNDAEVRQERMEQVFKEHLGPTAAAVADLTATCKALLDKSKLQDELLNCLKLLKLRDQKLESLRRNLADSEFEVSQMRIALDCTAFYSARLEADRNMTELGIRQACVELESLAWEADDLAATAAAAAAAAADTACNLSNVISNNYGCSASASSGVLAVESLVASRGDNVALGCCAAGGATSSAVTNHLSQSCGGAGQCKVPGVFSTAPVVCSEPAEEHGSRGLASGCSSGEQGSYHTAGCHSSGAGNGSGSSARGQGSSAHAAGTVSSCGPGPDLTALWDGAARLPVRLRLLCRELKRLLPDLGRASAAAAASAGVGLEDEDNSYPPGCSASAGWHGRGVSARGVGSGGSKEDGEAARLGGGGHGGGDGGLLAFSASPPRPPATPPWGTQKPLRLSASEPASAAAALLGQVRRASGGGASAPAASTAPACVSGREADCSPGGGTGGGGGGRAAAVLGAGRGLSLPEDGSDAVDPYLRASSATSDASSDMMLPPPPPQLAVAAASVRDPVPTWTRAGCAGAGLGGFAGGPQTGSVPAHLQRGADCSDRPGRCATGAGGYAAAEALLTARRFLAEGSHTGCVGRGGFGVGAQVLASRHLPPASPSGSAQASVSLPPTPTPQALGLRETLQAWVADGLVRGASVVTGRPMGHPPAPAAPPAQPSITSPRPSAHEAALAHEAAPMEPNSPFRSRSYLHAASDLSGDASCLPLWQGGGSGGAAGAAGGGSSAARGPTPAADVSSHTVRDGAGAGNGGGSGSASSSAYGGGRGAGPTALEDPGAELASLRLTNEALRRQLAELQRQNDLLQLQQLGGGGGVGCSGGGACGGPCQSGGAAWGSAAACCNGGGGAETATRRGPAAAAAATTAAAANPLAAPFYHGSLPPGTGSGGGAGRQAAAPVSMQGAWPPPCPSALSGGRCGSRTAAAHRAPATPAACRGGAHASEHERHAPLTPAHALNPRAAGSGVPAPGPGPGASRGHALATTQAAAQAGMAAPAAALAGARAIVAATGAATAPAAPAASGAAPAGEGLDASTDVAAAAAPPAQAPVPPPGLDPALWELELLVAGSRVA